MSAFPILEVAIGLSFTYLLLALITTTITEWISKVSNSRGVMLRQAVKQLVGEEQETTASITNEIFNHPLIDPLAQRKGRGGAKRIPSYIPSDLFAKTLTDVLSRRAAGQADAAPSEVPQKLRRALSSLQGPKTESLAPDPAAIQRWYEQHMDRVSGWYKRHTQAIVLTVAIVLTLITNANTVGLAQRLWTGSALRATIVEAAKVRLQQGPPLQPVEYEDPTTPKPTKPLQQTDTANTVLPEEEALLSGMLGWSGERAAFAGRPWLWTLTHLLGWFLSALAISLGAPFWFDMLNRLMIIRSSGPSPKEPGATK